VLDGPGHSRAVVCFGQPIAEQSNFLPFSVIQTRRAGVAPIDASGLRRAVNRAGTGRWEEPTLFESNKVIFSLLFGMLAVAVSISSPASAQHASFGGEYTGVGEAAGALLTLTQSGPEVAGLLQVDGAVYVIEASLSGTQGYGVLGAAASVDRRARRRERVKRAFAGAAIVAIAAAATNSGSGGGSSRGDSSGSGEVIYPDDDPNPTNDPYLPGGDSYEP